MRIHNTSLTPSMYPSMDVPIRTNMYPGLVGGNIDLRKQTDKILAEYGAYVLLRHYDITKRSKYWNPVTNEAVGGPPYEWTDYIVLSREVVTRDVTGAGQFDLPVVPGIITIPFAMFYFRWEPLKYGAIVENVDEIYKFPWSKRRAPIAEEVQSICTSKYSILVAVDLLGDEGRREYYACVCKMDLVGR